MKNRSLNIQFQYLMKVRSWVRHILDSFAYITKSRCGVILSLYNEAQSRMLRWPITGKTRHAAILFLNIKAKSRLRQWPHAIRILHFADLSVFRSIISRDCETRHRKSLLPSSRPNRGCDDGLAPCEWKSLRTLH